MSLLFTNIIFIFLGVHLWLLKPAQTGNILQCTCSNFYWNNTAFCFGDTWCCSLSHPTISVIRNETQNVIYLHRQHTLLQWGSICTFVFLCSMRLCVERKKTCFSLCLCTFHSLYFLFCCYSCVCICLYLFMCLYMCMFVSPLSWTLFCV